MVVTGGKGCSDQFKAEVSVLPRVHHRNHVILHGYFVQGDKRLFVYKYMPQENFEADLVEKSALVVADPPSFSEG
ncbi:hypothetical protein F2Q68_00006760 [Brassica cretica]|uniref:Serine-threonine/tyrosine-protein kinase catalytic domain-containing protein n=1 Tax=Brassica cretica TaxID=69181 RepID=A0A8S9JAF1_BRACR|nr:hypothetical protein F2Q68_00006760 [Brassica cretica]